MTEPILLRPAEAAVRLSISKARLYQLVRRGQLPGVVVFNGTIRVHRPTLEAALTEQAAGGQKASA